VITLITGAKGVGGKPIVEFAIAVFQNGSKVTGTFTTPLTATLSGPGKSALTGLFEVTAAGGTPVQGVVSGNSLVFSVPGDPVYELDQLGAVATSAPTASPSAGTTPAFTGANVSAEVLMGLVLLAVGVVLVLGSRRLTRSRSASPRSEP
jgi:hypothetical protein